MAKQLHNPSPVISIGMPVYNGEEYIREAIDSLLSQTFINFELIISDNGSTDNTEQICNDYLLKDSRIKYTRHSKNCGVIANFNYVLEKSKGAYFIWAADDDIWSNNWLECLLEEQLSTKSKISFGQVLHINQYGHQFNHAADNFSINLTQSKLIRRIFFLLLPESLGKANFFYALFDSSLKPTIAMYLNLFNKNQCFYDYTFIYNLLNASTIKTTNQATLFKRIHQNSESNKTINNQNLSPLRRLYLDSQKLLNPLPNLWKDYWQNSNLLEKAVIILIFIPKIMLDLTIKILIKIFGNNK